MRKQVKISEAEVNSKLWAYLLDLVILIVTTVGLYFASLYAFVMPFSNYKSNNAYINDIQEQYHMNYDLKQDRKTYEDAVKNYYFELFPNEIENHFAEVYGKRYSITHLYNVKVLGLPLEADSTNYDNSYFKYKNENGKIYVNEIGIEKDPTNTNPRYIKNTTALFRNAYDSLHTFTCLFDKTYETAYWDNIHLLCYTRLGAGLTSVLIFGLIIPLCFKYGTTLGEKSQGIAHAELEDGMIAKKYKIALRPLILYTLPLVGVYFGSIYAIAILCGGVFLIDILVMILSKDNRNIPSKILRIEQCYVKDSLLFKNSKEEQSFIESEEFKKIDNPDYLEKLANSKPIDLSVSRSDNIIKDKKD